MSQLLGVARWYDYVTSIFAIIAGKPCPALPTSHGVTMGINQQERWVKWWLMMVENWEWLIMLVIMLHIG